MKHKLPIKAWITIGFSAFTIIVIGGIWLLNYLLFNGLYLTSRKQELSNGIAEAKSAINSEVFSEELLKVSVKYGISMVAITENGLVYEDARASAGHSALLNFGQGVLAEVFVSAQRGGGKHSQTDNQFIIFAEIVQTQYGAQVLIIAEARTKPEGAVYEGAIKMLGIISAIIFGVATIVVLAVAKWIIKPAEKLSESAEEFTKGRAGEIPSAGAFKETHALSQALKYAVDEIASLDKLKKDLIANISHDLKTPLALIKGYAEVLRDFPSKAGASEIQIIIDETDRLTGLVNSILDLSKIQESKGEMNFSEFDLVLVLEDIVNRHKAFLGHKGYKIEFNHTKTARVFADEVKITQAVYNLFSNAVTYAGEDKTIIVNQLIKGKNVRVEIIDHGDGMDVKTIERIWDRYYKSEKNHNRPSVGTGLGLSIVKEIITATPGGVYGVESSIGGGSKFYIEIPCC
ncbi:MAG: HAMP domain-containing histidine kinase [Firmicutes bacterium]|nr:HAMP domain-containing histidine kinase [Bacillota bacterium]